MRVRRRGAETARRVLDEGMVRSPSLLRPSLLWSAASAVLLLGSSACFVGNPDDGVEDEEAVETGEDALSSGKARWVARGELSKSSASFTRSFFHRGGITVVELSEAPSSSKDVVTLDAASGAPKVAYSLGRDLAVHAASFDDDGNGYFVAAPSRWVESPVSRPLGVGEGLTLGSSCVTTVLAKFDGSGRARWARSLSVTHEQGGRFYCGAASNGLAGSVVNLPNGDVGLLLNLHAGLRDARMSLEGSAPFARVPVDATGGLYRFSADGAYLGRTPIARVPIPQAGTLDALPATRTPTGFAFVRFEDPRRSTIQAFASDGTPAWSKTVDVPPQALKTIASDDAGNVVLTGTFDGELTVDGTTLRLATGDTERDAFVMKVAPTGRVVFLKALGGVGLQLPVGVATVGAQTHVLGWFSQTASVGTRRVTSAGTSTQLFLAGLGADGRVLYLRAYGAPNASERARALSASRDALFLTGSAHEPFVMEGRDVDATGGELGRTFTVKVPLR